MTTLKNRILAAKDLKEELMTVSEWDGAELLITGMSGRTREKFLNAVLENGGGGDDEAGKAATKKAMLPLLPDFIMDGVRDPITRERVFELADVEALKEKNGEVLQRIAMKVISLSGLGEKGVEKAQGNSSDTPNGGST